jgi:hypothetical protein
VPVSDTFTKSDINATANTHTIPCNTDTHTHGNRNSNTDSFAHSYSDSNVDSYAAYSNTYTYAGSASP